MKPMPQGSCYLNGAMLPLSEARISPLDRGFLFGDGVYELVPVYGGRMFRVEDHLERLDRSLARLRMANPLSRHEWMKLGRDLVERAGGRQELRHDHARYRRPSGRGGRALGRVRRGGREDQPRGGRRQ